MPPSRWRKGKDKTYATYETIDARTKKDCNRGTTLERSMKHHTETHIIGSTVTTIIFNTYNQKHCDHSNNFITHIIRSTMTTLITLTHIIRSTVTAVITLKHIIRSTVTTVIISTHIIRSTVTTVITSTLIIRSTVTSVITSTHIIRSTVTTVTDVRKTSTVTEEPSNILYKSIAGRYRPVSYPDGPITARYRFIKNASWESPWNCQKKAIGVGMAETIFTSV